MKNAAEQKGRLKNASVCCIGCCWESLQESYVVPMIGMVVSLTGKIVMKFFG